MSEKLVIIGGGPAGLSAAISAYDSGLRDGKKGLTQTEAIHRIVEKINLIIQHFNVL